MKKLEWDSRFFQKEIYELTREECELPMNGGPEKWDVIQTKCFVHEREKISDLETNGFHFEDLRITFEKKVGPRDNDTNIPIRRAKKIDINAVRQIARSIFSEHSRFLSVAGRDKTEAFYAKWAEVAVNGHFDDDCFVLEKDGEIIGFITSKKISEEMAGIGLLGVRPGYRGLGAASSLLSFMERHAMNRGNDFVRVVTEGKNDAALNLYEKNGYRTAAIELWFYKMRK